MHGLLVSIVWTWLQKLEHYRVGLGSAVAGRHTAQLLAAIKGEKIYNDS
jgi:hypothetical protein